MSNFSHVNLMAIDNIAAERGPGFEARFARSSIDSEHLGVSYFAYPPATRVPIGHSHREQEEAYVVVSGSGRMRLDDEIIELNQWDLIRVAPSVVRGFESGPDGIVYIAVGNDRPEGGDGQRVDDFWPAD
jgi:quercetin dioxygenase-like cupin family protein